MLIVGLVIHVCHGCCSWVGMGASSSQYTETCSAVLESSCLHSLSFKLLLGTNSFDSIVGLGINKKLTIFIVQNVTFHYALSHAG